MAINHLLSFLSSVDLGDMFPSGSYGHEQATHIVVVKGVTGYLLRFAIGKLA